MAFKGLLLRERTEGERRVKKKEKGKKGRGSRGTALPLLCFYNLTTACDRINVSVGHSEEIVCVETCRCEDLVLLLVEQNWVLSSCTTLKIRVRLSRSGLGFVLLLGSHLLADNIIIIRL